MAEGLKQTACLFRRTATPPLSEGSPTCGPTAHATAVLARSCQERQAVALGELANRTMQVRACAKTFTISGTVSCRTELSLRAT